MAMMKPRQGLGQLRDEQGQSLEDVCNLTGLSKTTLIKIERAEEVLAGKLARFAKCFGRELGDVRDQPILPPLDRDTILDCVIRHRGPVQTAANGLQWRVCEIEHKYLPTTQSKNGTIPKKKYRAKLYDLSEFEGNADQWREKTTYLLRHADVCERIGRHPNIAQNMMAFQDKKDARLWWVWDEWIEGAVTLEDRLSQGRLCGEELMRCMKGIAAGLEFFHKKRIVRRALTPQSIQLSPKRVVLTDFELAKLLDGSPTVRPNDRAQWMDDIYVAPEANHEEGDPDRDKLEEGATSWDLFSWAVILAHAVSGRQPISVNGAGEAIREAALPGPLVRFAVLCLRPQLDRDPARRRPKAFPANLDSILTAR